jgi:hypothetical protein
MGFLSLYWKHMISKSEKLLWKENLNSDGQQFHQGELFEDKLCRKECLIVFHSTEQNKSSQGVIPFHQKL